MTQPRKSLAELLAERAAAKAEANLAEPTKIEADSEPEPIAIIIVPAPMPAEDPAPERLANVSAPSPAPTNANESKPRSRRLPPLPYNPIPSNEVCGARTKRGTICQSRALYRSGRCKNHGGMSTGPRTAEGKARARLNGLAPKRPRKADPMAG
jgi:hypothetical protein